MLSRLYNFFAIFLLNRRYATTRLFLPIATIINYFALFKYLLETITAPHLRRYIRS